MRIKKHSKGQSLVEYAVIAFFLVIVLVGATNGLSYAMKTQVESTVKGLSSESYLKPR